MRKCLRKCIENRIDDTQSCKPTLDEYGAPAMRWQCLLSGSNVGSPQLSHYGYVFGGFASHVHECLNQFQSLCLLYLERGLPFQQLKIKKKYIYDFFQNLQSSNKHLTTLQRKYFIFCFNQNDVRKTFYVNYISHCNTFYVFNKGLTLILLGKCR